MNKFLNFAPLAIALLLASCSTKPALPQAPATETKVEHSASIEAKQVAAHEETTHVAEIIFQKNSTQLTASNKAEIQKRITEAQQVGPVKNIRVLTWADSEYPSVNTKKLSKEERDLVKNRNNEIEKYLKSTTQKVNIKTYSMAERPGVIKDMLGGEGSRLKKSLEMAGIPNTDTSVKNPSKASHAIVIIELK
jgi:hypothetical protein